MKPYKIAPEDSTKWKCNWLSCTHGMGLAGNGCCSARGDWNKKNCKHFITEKDFIIDCEKYFLRKRKVNSNDPKE